MRGFLYIGLAEMEVPADDEDDNNSPARASPMMSRGRRRRGAGSKNASNPVSMIPTAQEAILPITGSTALRLASLLIHKQLNKDEWEDDWNKVETELRNECLEKGVHPAWIALGEKLHYSHNLLPSQKPKQVRRLRQQRWIYQSTDFWR